MDTVYFTYKCPGLEVLTFVKLDENFFSVERVFPLICFLRLELMNTNGHCKYTHMILFPIFRELFKTLGSAILTSYLNDFQRKKDLI